MTEFSWLSFRDIDENFPLVDCSFKIYSDSRDFSGEGFYQDGKPTLDTVVSLHQIHSDKIYSINSEVALGKFMLGRQNKGDGIVTDLRNIGVRIKVADCVPVLLYEPCCGVLALLHSGWEGSASNISGKALQIITSKYTGNPEDVRVYMGPHICGEHYLVEEERIKFFPHLDWPKKNGKYQLDLYKVIKNQLVEKGCKEENIYHSELCTFENEFLESYRRDREDALPMEFICWLKER